MMSHSRIRLRAVVTALCGAGLAMGIVVNSARADEWDKKTILTVNQPIQVKETLLPPGTYVFKLMNSPSERHVVQIFNSDQSHLIDTVLAIPNYRLQPTGDSKFAFWETPPGNAKALRAWFYPGDNYGQEFPYPKHFIALESSVASTSTITPTQSAVVTQPAQPESVQQSTQETERQETFQESRQPETQPQQMAEATPPPPPPTTMTTPEAPPQAERSVPESLPKTASPYPLLGLTSLISLGLYSLLRLTRHA